MEGEFEVLHHPVGPFLPFLPRVPIPNKSVPFRKKVIYTVISLFIVLVFSKLPLYGIHSKAGADPFYWKHFILGLNRGTVMDLGFNPLVKSRMMQLAFRPMMRYYFGLKYIIALDLVIIKDASKLSGIFIACCDPVAYIAYGMYGSVSELGVINVILIWIQLCFAGIIVMFLDELLQNGYGLGSGMSLFIATNICENIIWKAFSPSTIYNSGGGAEFEGAVIALFHLLITKTDKFAALHEALYRQNLPNITNLMATVLVFLIVIGLQEFRVSVRSEYGQGLYPMKLFYTFNLPIIFLSVIVSNIYLGSQFLYRVYSGHYLMNLLGKCYETEYKDDPVVNLYLKWKNSKYRGDFLLGKWKQSEYSGDQFIPSGGVVYSIIAPPSLSDVKANPMGTVLYLVFMFFSCMFWSSSCPILARAGPFTNQVKRRTKIALYGGICIWGLIVFADLVGAIGSGIGIMLVVSGFYDFIKELDKERATELWLPGEGEEVEHEEDN